ncbi:DUF695 domain-containing protein [Candidatus Riflebacteria bacterium]
MSDTWEIYPCDIDGNIAFVSCDIGIAESVPLEDKSIALKIHLQLKNPDENGLPTDSEFEVLKALEDAAIDVIEKAGAIFVGRVTCAGSRYYICYMPEANLLQEPLESIIADKFDYKLQFLETDDPDWDVYWDELYPTEYDWQVINNRRLLETLQENGDALTRARRIDHWLYFATEDGRAKFEEEITTRDFKVEGQPESDKEDFPFGLQIYHSIVPDYQAINAITIDLIDLAKNHDGNYDGWETEVLKGGSAAP